MRISLISRVAWIRAGIVLVILLAWQFLPQIPSLREVGPVFDPFFVSSPSRVAARIVDLVTGANRSDLLWPFLFTTLQAMFFGVTIGTIGGALLGLVLSNSPRASSVLSPFLVALNATPRIALIPITVIIFGPTLTASVVTVVMIVFFLVFFNAYEGGLSVPRHVLDNARVFGANSRQIMRDVRLPYVYAWTFAALPNALSLGLVVAVTAEILTGNIGIGRLLVRALAQAQADLTFAIVVVLAVIGYLLVQGMALIGRRSLHWWHGGSQST